MVTPDDRVGSARRTEPMLGEFPSVEIQARDELLQHNSEDRMIVEDVGREGLRVASRVAVAAVAIPVAAGYVALGATVLVGR